MTPKQINRFLLELRGTLRAIEESIDREEWEEAYTAAQELAATSTEVEYAVETLLNRNT